MISANERYEIKAHMFYLETGLLAPGKDMPMGTAVSYDVREYFWLTWLKLYEPTINKTIDACDYVLIND